MNKALLMMCVVALAGSAAWAQSSSLYVRDSEPAAVPAAAAPTAGRGLSSAVARSSLSAVLVPEPRHFALHDLVTIIVRESTEAGSDADLKTSKDYRINARINEFPDFSIRDLLKFVVKEDKGDNAPGVDISAKNNFKGSGDYSRRDTFTSRVTARILDVKPNGTIVLEARKHIQSDRETMTLVLTGTCRREDINADNTILSTLLYDLHLVKEHAGEVRKASKKGILTKVFDLIFNF